MFVLLLIEKLLKMMSRWSGLIMLGYMHRNKFSRFSMLLALSRGILLRPRSEGSTVLGLGLYLHS